MFIILFSLLHINTTYAKHVCDPWNVPGKQNEYELCRELAARNSLAHKSCETFEGPGHEEEYKLSIT